jgi:hypothetical protein
MSKGLTAARAVASSAEGLEGVVAAHTVLSDVDGQAGRLTIRGYAVEDLAHRAGFEDVAHLLLDGFFDDCRRTWPPPWARPGSAPSPRSPPWTRGWPGATRSRPSAP